MLCKFRCSLNPETRNMPKKAVIIMIITIVLRKLSSVEEV